MSDLIVLKFGGSYLRGHADLVRAVHAIYAHVRRGQRVVCVTSAFYGRTDALATSLRSLDATSGSPSSRYVRAALLATGETETANLMVAALDRSGLPAVYADVRKYGPFVEPGTEEPTRFDASGLERLFAAHSVVVVPGFAAVEDDGERAPALLGRGGSDMTAVLLGRELGCRTVLVKDVEGLYTKDPSRPTDGVPPRRLARVSWNEALQLGPDILQPRAVRLAKASGLEFEVVGPGHVAGVRGTTVGAARTCARSKPASPRPVRVALLGLGTIGARVFAELCSAPDRFDVAAVLVRTERTQDRPEAARRLLTTNPEDVFAAQPEIVIEALGGHEPAAGLMARALRAGVHVVTANKVAAASATDPTLESLANGSGAQYRCSAAVGGSMPALEAVRRATRSADPLVGIEGVLNGTSNAVLGDLARGSSLTEAIANAQAAGLAEPDPSADLDGSDVCHKIELLARAAGWSAPRWLRVEGIDAGAERCEQDDSRLRLVGSVHLTEAGPVASVALRSCPGTHPFHAIDGEWNALTLQFASGETKTVRGRGAGPWPTATAVLGDVFDVARRIRIGSERPATTEEGA